MAALLYRLLDGVWKSIAGPDITPPSPPTGTTGFGTSPFGSSPFGA